MAKTKKIDFKKEVLKEQSNVEGSFKDIDFNILTSLMPQEDQDLLRAMGITDTEKFGQFLMMAGIDPEKAYKQANLTSSEEEFADSDIMLDDDDPRGELYRFMMEEERNILGEVFFLDKQPVKEYHIRIKLKNSPVKIWRELKVPSNITLELLAAFLIEAMGWDNTHLHQFRKGDDFYVSRDNLEEYDDSFGFGFARCRHLDANKFSIADVLCAKGDRIEFEYDFGDSWMHEMWVKGISDYELGEKPRVKLVKGQGCCPPEDCGGVWGYEDLLEIRLKKRKTADEKERLEWYYMDDKDFDPDFFDVEEYQEYVNDVWNEVQFIMEKEENNKKGRGKK